MKTISSLIPDEVKVEIPMTVLLELQDLQSRMMRVVDFIKNDDRGSYAKNNDILRMLGEEVDKDYE